MMLLDPKKYSINVDQKTYLVTYHAIMRRWRSIFGNQINQMQNGSGWKYLAWI